ncbi:ferredoxin [Tropicimonas marinistellae]|uniref:ferredoxin n=1 Tax=Tropicimonas marinistellae TaxID=1739787 RepID=UPI0008378EA5|nr:ferredoxin [Tropicimonas marinistellae]
MTAPVQTAGADLADISRAADARRLAVLGGFHAGSGTPNLPPGTATVLLLGPAEPGFWMAVNSTPEFRDGCPDPLDRWSRRTIGEIAARFDAVPLFPFDGPPYRPFVSWLIESGRAWMSPVSLLVHADAGLFLSVRGALAFRQSLTLPAASERPCESCAAQPCRDACPVGALRPDGYDVAACHQFLATDAGSDCMRLGCATRRTCPVSQRYPRDPAQSAFHMRAFHETP